MAWEYYFQFRLTHYEAVWEPSSAQEIIARKMLAGKLPVAPAAPQPEPSGPVPTVCEQPRKLLIGWHAIAAALGEKYTDHDNIKSLNERFNGPIVNKGPGTSPMVYRDALIQWWNQLAIQAEELANQREGARHTAEAQHDYGRDGTVAPEIGGEVKKRRSDRKPT
jgi:hypothetical protein